MTDQERNLKAEPRSHPVRYRPVGITLARTIHAMLIHFPQSLLRVSTPAVDRDLGLWQVGNMGRPPFDHHGL